MKSTGRRKFISSAFGISCFAAIGGKGFDRTSTDFKGLKLKGKSDSRVKHWDIITIGNLSRNRYWGESDEKPLHSAICTCSVISGRDFNLIVDPSLADDEFMKNELQRRTGLTSDRIDAVFITHQHGDHTAGLKAFPKARWLAGAEVARALNISAGLYKQVEPSGSRIFDSIDVIHTPGHTPDHHCLRFDYRGLSIVVAGDSIATRDFWDEKRSYYNVIDEAASKRSMNSIDSIADMIVPGHDNVFFNI